MARQLSDYEYARNGFFREERRWMETKDPQAYEMMQNYRQFVNDTNIQRDIRLFPCLLSVHTIQDVFREFRRYVELHIFFSSNAYEEMALKKYNKFVKKLSDVVLCGMFKDIAKSWLEDEGFDTTEIKECMLIRYKKEDKEGTLSAWSKSLDSAKFNWDEYDIYDIVLPCALFPEYGTKSEKDSKYYTNEFNYNSRTRPISENSIKSLESRYGIIIEGNIPKLCAHVPIKFYVQQLCL